MPLFEIEFEVYCECGEGLCNTTAVRKSRNRCVDQIVVEACKDCIEKMETEKDNEIYHLKEQILELENKIEELTMP
jgi:hypothetical protein